jgi:hypothetical protein
LLILGLLNVGNAASLYAIFVKGLDFALGIVPLFNFDRESNFPTLFNGLLLAGTSFWAFSISRGLKGSTGSDHAPWFALGCVMAFLCIDELCLIHEALDWILMSRIETSGAIAWPWVLPYAVLAIVVGSYFLRFFFRLERRFQWIFGLAGALYIIAAIGFEMLEAAYTEKHGEGALGFGILYTIEENLEMIAILLTNWGMMDYLVRKCEGHAMTLKIR